MNKSQKGKILVGTTLKAINRSKLYGTLDLRTMYLLDIINELILDCHVDKDHDMVNELSQLSRSILNTNPEICNYREKEFNRLDILGKKVKNLNNVISLNDSPVVTDYNCYVYEYEDLVFTREMFEYVYSDPEGDNLSFIKIMSLPSDGTLQYNGVNVIVGQIINIDDIGNLKFNLGLVYSDALNTSFNFQLADDATNRLFSNTATFTICVLEKHNTAPTISDNSAPLDDECLQFTIEHFTLDYEDAEDQPYDDIKITSLPAIGNIKYDDSVVSSIPFVLDSTDVNLLEYCLPVDHALVAGSIYSYGDSLSGLISECEANGFVLTDITDGDFNFIKTEEVTVNNTTNIYAYFDTSSMTFSDAVAAKNALVDWFNIFSNNNPQYIGNLYVIPMSEERWVTYGTKPQDGDFSLLTTGGDWASISQLPPNINTPEWEPDSDIIVLGFIDESHSTYHSNALADGFDTTVVQPTTEFTTDYIEFLNVYNNYDFFRAFLYPIVKSTTGHGGALVLQQIAALTGRLLTAPEIAAYNTTVDIDLLLTENPYEDYVVPLSSPTVTLEPLEDYNWGGQFDKLSSTEDVFSSNTFTNDLDTFLQGSTATVTTYHTIDGTLVTEDDITFTFQISDDDSIEPLFSNVATFTIEVSEAVNNIVSGFGDGFVTVLTNKTYTFTRANLTTELDPPYNDKEGDPAYKLLVQSLPEIGLLTLDGEEVVVNQEILFSDIDLGLFKYVPNTENGSYEIDFDFDIADAGSQQFGE